MSDKIKNLNKSSIKNSNKSSTDNTNKSTTNNLNNLSIFKYENITSIIIKYLTISDIINLSLCSKDIKKMLDPDNNNNINFIFLIEIINKYFDLDPTSNYIIQNKYILLGKNIKFGMNFKLFWKKLKIALDVYKDNQIGKRIKDFIKIHIFLPDLRKECFTLEFENSSIHELYSYDINQRLVHTYNFYSKYITIDNVIIHPESKQPIKILRERLLFEDSLIKFPELFANYVNNKALFGFVNNYISKNDYEKINIIYTSNPSFINDNCQNSHLKQIFNFILWIIHLFMMYCTLNFEIVNGLYDNIDNAEFTNEFLAKKNDLYNCALLINSTFENINIIVNCLKIYKDIYDEYKNKNGNTYFSLSNCSSADSESNIPNKPKTNMKEYIDKIISPKGKFTLYDLFLKIIDNLYIKKINSINTVFPKIAKEVIVEKFSVNPQEISNKNKKEEEKMDICEEDENEICSDDEDDDNNFSIDSIPSTKELFENCMNSFFDIYINGNNANAIMHSNFKINKDYIENYEKTVGNILEEQINKSLNEDKMPINQVFDIVEILTRCEGNSKNLFISKDSLSIMRRSKIRIMKRGFYVIFGKLLELIAEDFKNRIAKNNEKLFISASESLRIQDYKCNLEALSEEGEKNVEQKVENDYLEAQNYLTKKFNLGENESKLAKEYLYSVKIEYVYVFKKLLWNYYKQIEIYKERDSRIEYYFKNKIGKDDHIYDSANSNFEKTDENDKYKEKQSDLFRNNDFNENNEIQNIKV